MKDNKIEEIKNRQLMRAMWVLIITALAFYLGIVFLAAYTLGEGFLFGVIVAVSTTLFVAVALYALKIEVEAGYYECSNCNNRFKPLYSQAVIAPHFHTTRLLNCPKCNNRTWAKKVMTK